jgi:hypothetical protein
VAGALIDSVTAFEIGGETLAVSGAGIHSVQFLGTFDDNGAALDDFAFNPVTPVSVGGVVPEPDAAVLWAVGLVLLAGRRWLRRQRSTGGPASSSWKIGRCYRRKLYMK